MSEIKNGAPAHPLDDKEVTREKMTKYAKKLERVLGAEAVVVIGMFKDGTELRIQDAGKFPMPPDQFYTVMITAHQKGLMGPGSPKLKPTSRIIRPH